MMSRRVVVAASLFALAASAAVYPWLPAQVPVHFDLAGRADGWASRPFGAFLLPAIGLAMIALTYVRRRGVGVVLAVSAIFLAALDVLVLRAALGDATLGGAIWILAGAFLVAIGLFLPRVRPNRWVGVRTPWTARSPEVWARTQRVGGYAMLACGLLVMLSAGDQGPFGMALRGVAVIAAALVPTIYSWRIAS
ncbi:MAG TPA: SdpI family protein [Polyangiaceae bacterium]|jgi:uncharacterized membrane protein